MNNYVIMEYLRQHPEITTVDLPNIYTYFKFKAYLQTTLRCTRKAYFIREGDLAKNFSYHDPQELYQLSDAREPLITYESPYDVEWALEQLEPLQAEIIRLSFFNGRTDLEIAKQRNVSRQAVNALKQRALCRLKEILNYNA